MEESVGGFKCDEKTFEMEERGKLFQRKASSGNSLVARLRRTSFSACVYMLWRARNVLIFQQIHYSSDDVFRQIREIIMMKYGNLFKDQANMNILERCF